MVYLATTLTTSSCRVRVKCRILMQNCNMLVRVRVVTRASVGVMVTFYFAVVFVIFSQFYAFILRRCGMGTALGSGLGSRG